MRGLLLVLTIVVPSVCVAQVYRSVAPDGTIIYSDVPTGSNAQRIELSVSAPADPAPAAKASDPAPRSAGRPASAAATGQRDTDKPSSPKLSAQEKAKRCQLARDRAQRYSVAHRLYRPLPNGGRDYLSSDEIDAARAQAAAAVERWCNA